MLSVCHDRDQILRFGIKLMLKELGYYPRRAWNTSLVTLLARAATYHDRCVIPNPRL